MLIAQILGLSNILGTDNGWPYLFAFVIVPGIVQLLTLWPCPESPRHLLITCGKMEAATVALRKLRGFNINAAKTIEDELEEMCIERNEHTHLNYVEQPFTIGKLFTSKSLRWPLVIAIVMQLSQQLSGINAIFYYSTKTIFTSAGLSPDAARFCNIGVGIVMIVMTFVSLLLIDRTGRRTLHLIGLIGMFISSLLVTLFLVLIDKNTVQDSDDTNNGTQWMSYISVASTLIFVIFFAIGPGSIPWLITAELFSQRSRTLAMSVAVITNWTANFIVGILFPLMTTFQNGVMEHYALLPFTVCLALFAVFTYYIVPETKNKTFDQIATLYRMNKKN